jgi:hypothetical protein
VQQSFKKIGKKIAIPLKATDRLCPLFFFRGPFEKRKEEKTAT